MSHIMCHTLGAKMSSYFFQSLFTFGVKFSKLWKYCSSSRTGQVPDIVDIQSTGKGCQRLY